MVISQWGISNLLFTREYAKASPRPRISQREPLRNIERIRGHFLQSLKSLTPEVERDEKENPEHDSNAILVHSLLLRKTEASRQMGIGPDKAHTPGISKTFNDVAERMNALIEASGDFELKMVDHAVRYGFV